MEEIRRRNGFFAGKTPSSKFEKILGISLAKIFDFYSIIHPAGKGKFHISCPFHKETKNSFFVTLDSNFAYCFGCGRALDPLGFVQEKEKCGRRQAFLKLAEIGHIELDQSEIDSLYHDFNKVSLEQTEEKQAKVLDKIIQKVVDKMFVFIRFIPQKSSFYRLVDDMWGDFDSIMVSRGMNVVDKRKVDEVKDWYHRWVKIFEKFRPFIEGYKQFPRETYSELVDEPLGTKPV